MVPFNLMENLLVGKKRQEIGIITMRMESPHLVKRISMEAHTTLTKKV